MGNTDSNPWIPLTQQFQEIEKIRFSYDLRKNPDDFNKYVSERVDRISKETLDKKRASFQKAHTDMGRYMDMDHNAGYYKSRNKDLLNIQTQLLNQSRAAVSGMRHDKDLTRRQTEINEWYFNDKLETLFFLQIFFITMLASAIVLYLQKNGFISAPFAAFLTAILLAIVIGTGLYRHQYTSETRDSRFWHRRNFYDKKLFIPTKPTPDCGCDTPKLPDPLSACAKKGLDSLTGAKNAAQKYAADSTAPYGQAALAGWKSVVGGADTAGSGFGQAAAGVGIAFRSIGTQALSDARSNTNRVGEAANRAQEQLEADTLAYITGDRRPKVPKRAGGLGCPF
jgi:hypothetical protein